MNRRLTIASNPAAIGDVEDFLQNAAQEIGINEDQCGDLIIAGTEAANNAILHGNSQQEDLEVTLEISTSTKSGKRCLVLEIDDNGTRSGAQDIVDFDPGELPDPTLPENLLKNSGRGLLIIKHLMDEVNIESRKNGTAVIMVKYF